MLSTIPARPSADHDQLLAQARAGDAGALAELFDQIRPQVERQARRFVASHEVDDVVAETFVNVLRAIRGGAGPAHDPIRYVMFAVRTTAWRMRADQANEIDKARRHEVLARPGPLAVEQPADAGLGAGIEDERLIAAFRTLRPRFRRVIWWTTVEGWTTVEVADHLSLSPNAAAALAYRARGALRRAYEDQLAPSDADTGQRESR